MVGGPGTLAARCTTARSEENRSLCRTAQPASYPVSVQAFRRAQRADHELDGVLDIPGLPEALRRRPAPGRAELARDRHHGTGQAGEFGGVIGVERPAGPPGSPGRGAQAGDLITQPAPGVSGQVRIPEPLRRLVAGEPGMVVRRAEAA